MTLTRVDADTDTDTNRECAFSFGMAKSYLNLNSCRTTSLLDITKQELGGYLGKSLVNGLVVTEYCHAE